MLVCQCPRCGRRYGAEDRLAGTQTQCAACGAAIQVPMANPYQHQPMAQRPMQQMPMPQMQMPMYPTSPAQPTTWNQPQQASGGMSPPMILMCAGGVIVVLLSVIGILMLRGGKSTPTQPEVAAFAPTPPATPNIPPNNKPMSIPAPTSLPSKPAAPTNRSIIPTPQPGSPNAPAQGNTNSTPNPAAKPNNQVASNSPIPSAKPNVVPKPRQRSGSDWEGSSAIPVEEHQPVIFGPPGCPVVVTSTQVWEIGQKKMRSELEGKYKSSSHKPVLSPDGSMFAGELDGQGSRNEVGVWDTQTGKIIFSDELGSGTHLTGFMFLSDEHFMVGVRSNEMLIWEAKTGKQHKTIKFKDASFDDKKTAVSADGKYIATSLRDRIVVIRVADGKVAATMGSPKSQWAPEDIPPSMVKEEAQAASSRYTNIDPMWVYLSLDAISFSDDLLELAAVSHHPSPHVMCWSNRGKLVFDSPIATRRFFFGDASINWFPSRTAWMVQGNVFDREASKIVLSVKHRFGRDFHCQILDDNTLLGTFPQNPSQLEQLTIPWKEIRASLEAMKNKEPALLSPAESVSVVIELEQLRGDQQETTQLIENALKYRLKRDGISVADGKKTFFRLKFAEKEGDRLPIYQRQSPFDFRGTNTGQTATEAKGSLIVELVVPDQDEPLWRETLNLSSSRSFSEEINDVSVRKSMLNSMADQISHLSFPYFVPKSKDLYALPVVLK